MVLAEQGASFLSGQGGPIIMLVLIFAVMYFVMIRPQRKKQKQIEEMRSAIKAGDRITTIGGLKGKIVRVTDDAIMIEVGPEKTRMEFMKWAVSKVEEKGAPGQSAGTKPGKAGTAPAEEPAAEEEAEAPKAVKKPKRLGSKPSGAANKAAEAEEEKEADE
jgi:preprotein translocase subunit YajC